MPERTPEEIEALRKAGFGIRPDGHAQFGYNAGDPQPHEIKMSDARDTAKYMAAKAAAEEDGQMLKIIPDDPPAAKPDDVALSNFDAPDPVRITREQASDVTLYRAAKAKAERDGVELEILDG